MSLIVIHAALAAVFAGMWWKLGNDFSLWVSGIMFGFLLYGIVVQSVFRR